MTTVPKQPSSASSSYPQPARNTWNEGQSTFKWKCTRYGRKVSGYQVSADLDNVEFYWGNDQLDVIAVFRAGIYTAFSPTAFDNLQMRGSAENPIVLDEEGDKKNSLPPSTPVSARPTWLPALLRSRPFGTRIEDVPEFVYRKLFQYVLLCLCFNVN